MIINIPKDCGILVLVVKNLVFILQLKSNKFFGVFIEWLNPME
jgi:hypothetical protein